LQSIAASHDCSSWKAVSFYVRQLSKRDDRASDRLALTASPNLVVGSLKVHASL
jgi:hypothetical protein